MNTSIEEEPIEPYQEDFLYLSDVTPHHILREERAKHAVSL